MNTIKLKLETIIKVPFQSYDKDFVFLVNGKEFRTSHFVADLLSPSISKIHANDPTLDIFTINTKNAGDFTHILNLVNFDTNQYSESEFPFIFEVIELLGNGKNEIDFLIGKEEMGKITSDNVFSLIQQCNLNSEFFDASLRKLISFISSHFTELCESHKEELSNLNIDILFEIINNDVLQIESEDQLLNFINCLYSQNSKYSILYEKVYFENLSKEAISEFITIYDINDMTAGTWNQLTKRLSQAVEEQNSDSTTEKRYKTYPKFFSHRNDKEFNGIINFLRELSKDQIEREIVITSSSIKDNLECYHPRVVADYDDPCSFFFSKSNPNEWICFDFKEHRVVPAEYTIRSFPNTPYFGHPKSWVIEGSNDNNSYEIISEENNNSLLNGCNLVHTLPINRQQSKEYKYIRMRLTGPNWFGDNGFLISSFEIYGKLI